MVKLPNALGFMLSLSTKRKIFCNKNDNWKRTTAKIEMQQAISMMDLRKTPGKIFGRVIYISNWEKKGHPMRRDESLKGWRSVPSKSLPS